MDDILLEFYEKITTHIPDGLWKECEQLKKSHCKA